MRAEHEKFAKYWESIGNPPLEFLACGGKWEGLSIEIPQFDSRDYRLAGDPHWKLRRKWIDSDFTLPLEMRIEGGSISGPIWMEIIAPTWDKEIIYRKAEPQISNSETSDSPKYEAEVAEPEVSYKPAAEHTCKEVDPDKVAWVNSPSPNELGVNHPMYEVFMDAIEQATGGKGKRHGGARTPFLEQRWHRISQSTGFRSLVYQMCKKAEEACDKDDYEAFERELLGALNYGGMALIHVRKHGFTKEVKVDDK